MLSWIICLIFVVLAIFLWSLATNEVLLRVNDMHKSVKSKYNCKQIIIRYILL